MIIDGKSIASSLYENYKNIIKEKNIQAKLAIILVGDSSASLRYIKQKKKWAEYVGIDFELHQFEKDVEEKTVLEQIKKLNTDEQITGFLVQLPLPKHIDEQKVIRAIDPKKDVDGFHPINQGKILTGDNSGLLPCTPAGIMEIFSQENIELKGAAICVIGRSTIVGKPVANLLINAGATVTVCNSATKNLSFYTKNAEIIVIATGQPLMLTSEIVSDDTVIIDVGFSVVDGKILGDADFNALEPHTRITPVPGGVGPLTVAMIMKNILKIKNSL